ncbi:FAD-dependent oxidoreductase [Rhodococcus sp. BP-252]|uniref:FAD-dependent oxidoreductase n=1 Tax=unclassified Rhodococcus (in: high G+C Gram-positive bacteria) TaxID=192944 RepID=UPI001C9A5A73|nr:MULTISPECIES: FAD-dependent oxidoreductase [unclassified Rhodococcus (in: high G+C Gram-positive bacteria)]MBY6412369.1 FAD-dependent oxidoreductase [Rhodococcus sp. BP-320]MBY6416949.1 FAD-dependent oxidoreductase [Rhodococcus sp. BP-321]MBY6422088.1 FAD-dependent oxidoreductase [Rhodococcus sp. BP-324]MBY6426973.1 FAD-dependent oxidoreductase [Rhodococcus sp. BP-323]MBY6432302.1 FAD-dependent oxidoreductase [Rhodococcus sp. BP-322]
MTFVILQQCCNDASCTDVCPVDCIHPTPDEPEFMTSDMLHIEPDVCIDCGACVDECPVDAIRADHELDATQGRYLDLNADWFELHPSGARVYDEPRNWAGVDFSGRRVAVVGTGPAAFYAATELAGIRGIEVEMYDRLLTPYGLVRSGVAPDHPGTKAVTDLFRSVAGRKSVRLHLGVEIGSDLTHDDLIAHHDAVLYATGAADDRTLGIAGEELSGSHSAREFVAWYNGHPEYADRTYDLSSPRAVVVGNGNVALDVARILLAPITELEKTDIADHALEALRSSAVREVVVVGRRGPSHAAYTGPELLEIMASPWIDLHTPENDVTTDEATRTAIDAGSAEATTVMKVALAREIAARPTSDPVDEAKKRLILRFGLSPAEILGDESVSAIRFVRATSTVHDDGTVTTEPTGEEETIDTGLVLRSVGYRGRAVESVPFDHTRGIIPNRDGRVIDDDGSTVPGVYVTGWIKRGPSGVIGTNRKCAAHTVAAILEDIAAESIPRAPHGRVELDAILAEKCPDALDFSDWSRIDEAERNAGAEHGRPRIKYVGVDDLRSAVVRDRTDRY